MYFGGTPKSVRGSICFHHGRTKTRPAASGGIREEREKTKRVRDATPRAALVVSVVRGVWIGARSIVALHPSQQQHGDRSAVDSCWGSRQSHAFTARRALRCMSPSTHRRAAACGGGCAGRRSGLRDGRSAERAAGEAVHAEVVGRLREGHTVVIWWHRRGHGAPLAATHRGLRRWRRGGRGLPTASDGRIVKTAIPRDKKFAGGLGEQLPVHLS